MVARQDKAVAAEERSLDSIHHEVLGFVMKLSKPLRINYWSWYDDRNRSFRAVSETKGSAHKADGGSCC
jgi:hypothetical protein